MIAAGTAQPAIVAACHLYQNSVNFVYLGKEVFQNLAWKTFENVVATVFAFPDSANVVMY